MNDRMTYTTKQEAEAEAAKMVGWIVKAAPITVYDGDNNVATRWGLMCKQGKISLWLREDGYVR